MRGFSFIRAVVVMVSLHSDRTATKTEVSTWEQGSAVMGRTRLVVGGMWTLGLWIRKEVERFKWSLMGHTSRIIKDNAESNLNDGGSGEGVSEWGIQELDYGISLHV